MMSKRRDGRAAADRIRRAARNADFRNAMASGHLAPPTDERFQDLLRRLDEAEARQKRQPR